MRCTLTSEERVDRGRRWRALGPAQVVNTQNGLRLAAGRGGEEVRALRLRARVLRVRRLAGDGAGRPRRARVTADGAAVAAVQSLFGSLRK
jgi:hypothetical protein